MKRAAVILLVALINTAAFGVSGSATAAPPQGRDREAARQAGIISEARRVPPGTGVRILRMNGIREEGLFDRVTADAIQIIQVSDGQRFTTVIALKDVKDFSLLKGTALKKLGAAAGVGLAVLFGLCLVAANAGR